MGTSLGTIKAGVHLTYGDTVAPELRQPLAQSFAKRPWPVVLPAQLPNRQGPAVIPRRDYGPK